jgi:predicted Zn finger-like uncharacterized protein
VKFFCDQCKAKYQIADEKVVGKTVRMKCRKCGHIIELRAEITESSVIGSGAGMPAANARHTHASGAPAEGGAPRPPTPRPPARPPPKPNALATSLTSAKPAAPKPERLPGGALAGAFRSNVQHEEEGSAPFDMADLAPGDDWYVAVNGVPVGPIRVAEVRRKAALGAVTEDSLVWQEGLDEWRPLKSFPDLAANVREAAASGRISMTPPPPDARHSSPPAARSPSMRTGTSSGVPSRVASTRPLQPSHAVHPSPPAAAARSNVVPFTSRLATAERLEEATELGALQALTADARLAAVPVTDPFASQPSAAAAPPGAAPPAVAPASLAPPPVDTRGKRQPPWIVIAMIAASVAFGTVAGISLFFKPAPQVIVQAPAATAAAVTAAPVAPAVVTTSEPVASAPIASAAPSQASRGPAAAGARSASSATPPGRSLDLHSLTQGTSVAPGEEPGSENAAAPGQCLSGGQVQQVIQLHQLALRRACWERNPTTKPTVNVGVQLTVGPDGSAQGVSTTGDEPSVTKCIETDVRGWHFPAMGCSQKTGFSFKFVRQ